MDIDRYSLKLRETLYTNNLYKSTFTHACYFNVSTSCRKQEDQKQFADDRLSVPHLSDFTSIDAVDNVLLSQSFPESKAFLIDSFEDVCLNLVREKQNYNKYFEHCRKKYKRQYKRINESVKKKKGDVYLPLYLINLCNVDDPDQYFDTFYNWYYTGGILDTISIDNQDYSVGILENDLCIRYLNNAKVIQNYHLDDLGQIFNIRARSHGNNNYLTLRAKNKLRLVHFNVKDDKLVLEEDWRATDEIPYIDFKLYSKNTIGSINMQNLFKSIDMETQKALLDHRIIEYAGKPNNYCLFDSIDAQNLLFMNRKQIKSFDVRNSKESVVLTLETFPMVRCEELSYFIVSKNNANYIFACTSHTVAKVDLRNKNIVKRWSHLLTAPPIMMDSIQNGNEYLCISSFNDRVLVCSTPEETNLPKLVPNPTDTFHAINLQQPIILEGLNKRLLSSINGLKLSLCCNNRNNIKIHYSNGFGDLFGNEVQLKSISRDTVDNTEAQKKMKKWLKSMQRKQSQVPKTVYATEMATEWSSIKQLHCKRILEENLNIYQDEAVGELNIDIDPYAFDMSGIWGARSGGVQLPEVTSSVRKVTEWLKERQTE